MVMFKSIALAGCLMAAQTNADFGDQIVNGQTADVADYPWMVSLRKYGRHNCGGALIAPNVVLTAAHCTRVIHGVTIKGSNTRLSTGAESHEVKRVYNHPSYNSATYQNDIALLELSTSSSITPVTWDSAGTGSTTEHAGQAVTVMGWGALKERGSSPRNLQEVTVNGYTNARCLQDYGRGRVTPDMFCAGFPQGGKDSCQGDSGGPLYRTINGIQVQVGVVSWGDGCARAGKPGIYSRVAYQKNWIQSVLNQIGTPATPPPTPGVGNCEDTPVGWYDAGGSRYTCAWYAKQTSRCAQYGDSYRRLGKTANEACCACGGGSTGSTRQSSEFAPETVGCKCSDSNGKYDICSKVDGFENGVCLIEYGGGRAVQPRCDAPVGGEIKYSTTYARWYMTGCNPLPRHITGEPLDNETPLVAAQDTTNQNTATTETSDPASTDNTILIVGASVGIIGAALVVGMIVTVKSKKSQDDFADFKVGSAKETTNMDL